MENNRGDSVFINNVDWVAITVYIALVLAGWFNIYAAVYDESHSSIFDMGQRYGMQLVWMGVSAFIALSILLIDGKYYHIFAYPLYWIAIIVLIAVMFLGKEVNGAKAWIVIGPIAIQPTEFVKFTTALALARYMSSYTFSIHNISNVIRVGLILGLPVMIVILQNDTGSALVYGAFLFMLYREGFNGWIYVVLFMVITLFILSFLLDPAILLIALLVACVVGEGVINRHWRPEIIYLSGVALATLAIMIVSAVLGLTMKINVALMICIGVSIIPLFIYAYHYKIRNMFMFVALFFGALMFTYTIDYIFDQVLQTHQQKRILNLLGLESDDRGWGYNVNQSMIAIGSGGFSGKGYLEGTQTKFNFVPEQSTDFIFCTVGEEWGFLGSTLIVSLFALLIMRLIRMGERQMEPFGRIYCYSVASIFLFHVLINIGMTIGLMPVIGIPLPFFSYGGSSMIAFTILFFVAIRLDMTKREPQIQ